MNKKGDRFGRLVILGKSNKKSKNRQTYYKCRCDCGVEKLVRPDHLVAGLIISCGCYRNENSKIVGKTANLKHGKYGTKIYEIYYNMIARCFNKDKESYYRYGGRGITVSKKWLDFNNFYGDMGDPPKGLSIERIDNNGNYSKQNCKWATKKEQANNRSPRAKHR